VAIRCSLADVLLEVHKIIPCNVANEVRDRSATRAQCHRRIVPLVAGYAHLKQPITCSLYG
jgi:hypothetical protein